MGDLVRASRFVSWDFDRDTPALHALFVDKAAGAGVPLASHRTRTPKKFTAAMSQQARTLFVMAHGGVGQEQGLGIGREGDHREHYPLTDILPARFDCESLIVLACHQPDHTLWRERVAPGTFIATATALISIRAIRALVPRLLADDHLNPALFDEAREQAHQSDRRVHSLRTDRWQLSTA